MTLTVMALAVETRPMVHIEFGVRRSTIEPDRPQLYVKLQLGSGKIIGRSFHYSDRSN